MLKASLRAALPVFAGTDAFAQSNASDEWLETSTYVCVQKLEHLKQNLCEMHTTIR